MPISWGGARGVSGAAYMAVPCVVSGFGCGSQPGDLEGSLVGRSVVRTVWVEFAGGSRHALPGYVARRF